MDIKKKDVRCELRTCKSATQRTPLFLSLRETLTVFGLGQSIMVIFRMRESKQSEDVLVHNASNGYGCTVSGRSFVRPCYFFVYVCTKICPFALSLNLIN